MDRPSVDIWRARFRSRVVSFHWDGVGGLFLGLAGECEPNLSF